jgi:hypothetical protein
MNMHISPLDFHNGLGAFFRANGNSGYLAAARDWEFLAQIRKCAAYQILAAAGVDAETVAEICVLYRAFRKIQEAADSKQRRGRGRPRSLLPVFEWSCDMLVRRRDDRRRFYAEFASLAAMVFDDRPATAPPLSCEKIKSYASTVKRMRAERGLVLANLIEQHLKLIRKAVIDYVVERYERFRHTKDPDIILEGTESILREGFTAMAEEMRPQLAAAFRRSGLRVLASLKAGAEARHVVDHEAIRYARERAKELIEEL